MPHTEAARRTRSLRGLGLLCDHTEQMTEDFENGVNSPKPEKSGQEMEKGVENGFLSHRFERVKGC